MAEGSIDAMILISTSWQALRRAELGDESTMVCNCTVILVFASFFIEANLNQIIEKMGMEKEMIDFLGNEHPGLQEKLAWFYNKFVARDKAATKKQFKSKKIYRKIRRKFTGFGKFTVYSISRRNVIARPRLPITGSPVCAHVESEPEVRMLLN